MPELHVVATTISVPRFLDFYLNNLRSFDRLSDAKFWVVGDLKTPPESQDYVDQIRRQGMNVEYLSPDDQKSWLRDYPDLDAMVPWNSDNRRNIGFARALQEGCRVLVAIDDDNYAVAGSDFIAGHEGTGRTVVREVIRGESGWFNICDELVFEPPVRPIPRGFPYRKRDVRTQSLGPQQAPIAATAGLWLGDPDVDAATRLALPLKGVNTTGRVIALEPGTWTPVNTQNTSVAREAIPAYYYVRMLEPLPGAKLDRYGDIWSGYFLQCCTRRMGHYVSIGQPVVDHRRNQHDLLEDMRAEFWGMIVTPRLVEALAETELDGDCYQSAARSLAGRLDGLAERLESECRVPGLAPYIQRIASHLRTWIDLCAFLERR